MRCALLVSALSLLVSFAVAQQTRAPDAAGARLTEVPAFSFEDLAQWLVAVRPEVATRPLSVAFVFDRTDSVWGIGAEKDVLPTVWRRDLLGNVLQSFLVAGYPERDVQGDRVSILGFGRREVVPIVLDDPFDREGSSDLRERYPRPYVDTPLELGGTFLDDHFADAVDTVEGLYPDDNVLILFITDDIAQGGDAEGPEQARAFRTYRATLQEGASRAFTVYLYWNDFPNPREFLYFDEDLASVEIERRGDRVAAQTLKTRPAEDFGDTVALPRPQVLQVSLAGDGDGALRTNPVGIDTAAGRFAAGFGQGTRISVTAQPAARSSFTGFDVDAQGASLCGAGSSTFTCVLSMDVDRRLTAVFAPPPPFPWVPVVVGAILFALTAFVLYAWLNERYEVRDDRGLLDRSTPVFPGRSRRIRVPNPEDPSDALGHLSVARPLPFGLSRLTFTASKGYAIELVGARRSTEPRRSSAGKGRKRRRSRDTVVLSAGRRKPERHVVAYTSGEAAASSAKAASPIEVAEGTAAIGTITLDVLLRASGTSKRARTSGGRSGGGQNASRSKRRGPRRVELSEPDEGVVG